MTERKKPWTPGPWRCIERDASVQIFAGNLHLATAFAENRSAGFTKSPNGPATWANARLIAEAPAMAELLRKITQASMHESRPTRGESLMGWQAGDAATAHEVYTEARALLIRISAP